MFFMCRLFFRCPSEAFDVAPLAGWVQFRRAQIDAGGLTYVAKQLDVFGTA